MSSAPVQFVATMDSTQLQNSARQSGQALEDMGRKGDEAGKKIGNSKATIGQASLAFTGLATNVWSAYNAYDALENIQLAQSRAQVALTRAQDMYNTKLVAVTQAEVRIAKMQKEGKENTTEYKVAIEKLTNKKKELQTATDDLRVKEQDLKIKTDDVTESQINFGLQMTTMATATIPMSIKSIVDLTGGMKGLSNMFKLLDLSMGKYILIATGVILAFEGIAHAIKYFSGGEIDITIEKLGGDLVSAMQNNTQEANNLAGALPNVSTAYGEMSGAIDTSNASLSEGIVLFEKNKTQKDEILNQLTGLKTEYGTTADAIYRFNQELQGKGVEDLQARITSLTHSLLSIDDSMDRTSAQWKRASAIMVEAVIDIAEEMDVISEEKANEFIDSMERTGKFTVEQMKEIRDSIKDVGEELDNVSKKKADVIRELHKKIKAERLHAYELSLDDFQRELETNKNLTLLRMLLDEASEQYKNGNIKGAVYLERKAMEMARSVPSISFTKGSDALAKFSSVLRGAGLIGNGTLASGALGSGIFSGVGTLGSFFRNNAERFSQGRLSITNKAFGTTIGAYTSYKSSGKAGASVAFGGTRASGRSSKHGNKGKGQKIGYAKAKSSALFNGITDGMNRQDLEKITGIPIEKLLGSHYFHAGNPNYRPAGRVGSNANYKAMKKGEFIRDRDARKSVLSQLASVSNIRQMLQMEIVNKIRAMEKEYGVEAVDEFRLSQQLEQIFLAQYGSGEKDYKKFIDKFIGKEVKDEVLFKHKSKFYAGQGKFLDEFIASTGMSYDEFVRDPYQARLLDDMIAFKNKTRYTIGT